MSVLLRCWAFAVLLLQVTSAANDDPQDLRITQVIRVGDSVTRIVVDKPVGPRAEVIITFQTEGIQTNYIGTRYNDSDYVMECSQSFSQICCNKYVGVVIVVREEESLLFLGEAALRFKDLDEKAVAVVGAREIEEGAFLRVSSGTVKQIEIEGEYCFNYNSPCYIKKRGTGNETKWCTPIENENGEDNETVAQCNLGVTPFKEIPSEFDAAFVLVDSSTLYLTYKLHEPFIEVLAVDPRDSSLLSNGTDYLCKGSNGDVYSCTVNVDIPDHKNSVNFIVVLTTTEGYAESSSTYSFETFQLQVEYLTDGAIYLSWIVEHPGEYDVSVTKGFDFHNVKFRQSISCESGRTDQGMISCHAYFIHVEDGDVVAVQQKGSPDVMAVFITFPGNK